MILLWAGLIILLMFGLTALIGAPYVPSHRSAVRKAFSELRPIGKQDLVVDIGSGDGTVLKIVAERGARGFGVEINLILVMISRFRLRNYKHLVSIKTANLWHTKFPSETTVVYTFGESRDIKKMYQKAQVEATRLDRSLDFLSYGFEVPGVEATNAKHGFYLYRLQPLQSD